MCSKAIVSSASEDGKIVTLSLNQPQKLNAVDRNFIKEMTEYSDMYNKDKNIRTLMMTSELNKAFCSGIDTAYVQSLTNEESISFFSELAMMLEKVRKLPFPTIAAVSGYVFGAGADLALACDIRVAAHSAKFSFPGPKFGLVLGTRRLIHEVGPSRARFLTLTGKILDAKNALDCGIVHEVVEESHYTDVAYSWATKIMDMPKHSLDTILNLCTDIDDVEKEEAFVVDLVEQSVAVGNFSERFNAYLQSARKK